MTVTREQKTVDWRELAKALAPRTQAFIDGEYVPAISGATFDCINPANGRVIAQVASCDAADVEVAVASSRRAFEGGAWSRRAPAARKKVLLRFDDGHGQAHLGLDEGRRPGGRELHRLVRRGHRQGL
jgi:delta 1-pyrroline-5-carboxylate dehydrogenase